jgi:hypothetical protein
MFETTMQVAVISEIFDCPEEVGPVLTAANG